MSDAALLGAPCDSGPLLAADPGLAILLQWMLRHRIPNPWVRVLGSWAVVGAVLNAAFFAVMNSLSDFPG